MDQNALENMTSAGNILTNGIIEQESLSEHNKTGVSSSPAEEKGAKDTQSNASTNEIVQVMKIDLEKPAQKLPRKEWRQFKKKQRKKLIRIEGAKFHQRQQVEQEKQDTDTLSTEIMKKANEAEERKRNAERILWEVKERQIEKQNAERRENWAKTVKSITIKKPKLSSDSSSNPTDFLTNKETNDEQLCSFYLKTGACRYGDLCDRYHPYPEKSVTILVRNMYVGMPVQLADEENDDNLEFDDEEAERHYFEFFEDVHSEFLSHGKIVQFKVCSNFQPHLRGNVYVQYEKEEEAERALESIRGRWYAGKQLIAEYCPVTKWKSAICGVHERNKCPKGIHCNFLHVFKNPRGLYKQTDLDYEVPHRRKSDSFSINNTNLTTNGHYKNKTDFRPKGSASPTYMPMSPEYTPI
ncbi:2523_t:CDS:2 [Ambispora gerdemannii]|uniref:2523_t:CDS:1 n=1 Tax=Ambispora gerdemannii TaxID=144530 RepID=A0A9N8V6Q0_9GLOM|nr:2523_t:CDS:2 [Ambispora gerdemannii]